MPENEVRIKQTVINGLVVIFLMLGGTTLILRETQQSPNYDVCRSGNTFGTWDLLQPNQPYYLSEFAPALGRYECKLENTIRWCRGTTKTRCYFLDKLAYLEEFDNVDFALLLSGIEEEGPKEILLNNQLRNSFFLDLFDDFRADVRVNIFYKKNDTTFINLNKWLDKKTDKQQRRFWFNFNGTWTPPRENNTIIFQLKSKDGWARIDGDYCIEGSQVEEGDVRTWTCLDMTDFLVKNNVSRIDMRRHYNSLLVEAEIIGPIDLDPQFIEKDEFTDQLYAGGSYYQLGNNSLMIRVSDDRAAVTIKPRDPDLIAMWIGYNMQDQANIQGYIDPTGTPSAGKYGFNETLLANTFTDSPNPGWRLNAEGDQAESIISLQGGGAVTDFMKVDYVEQIGGGGYTWYTEDHGIMTEIDYGAKRYYDQYMNLTGSKIYFNSMGNWVNSDNVILHAYGADGSGSPTYYDTAYTNNGDNLSVSGSLHSGGMNWSGSTGDPHIGLFYHGRIYYSMLLNKSWNGTEAGILQERFDNPDQWFMPFPDTEEEAHGYTQIKTYSEKKNHLKLTAVGEFPSGTNVSIRYRLANYSDLPFWNITTVMYDFAGGNLFPVKGNANRVDLYTSWEGSYEDSEYALMKEQGLYIDRDEHLEHARIYYITVEAGDDIATWRGGNDTGEGGGWCAIWTAFDITGDRVLGPDGGSSPKLDPNAGGTRYRFLVEHADTGTDSSEVYVDGLNNGDTNNWQSPCITYLPDDDLVGITEAGLWGDTNMTGITYDIGFPDTTGVKLMQSYGNSETNFIDGFMGAWLLFNQTPTNYKELLNLTKYWADDGSSNVGSYWSEWSEWSENTTGDLNVTYDAVQVEYRLTNPNGNTGLPILRYVEVEHTSPNYAPSTPTSITCDAGSCDGNFTGNVEMMCSGSDDTEGDTITYIIEKGNQSLQNVSSSATIDFEQFETDYGDWTQATFDNDDWSRGTSTPSSGTGPQTAYNGNFTYVETSSGTCNNPDTAVLYQSPAINFSQYDNVTLNMQVNMYGSTMGTLRIRENTTGSYVDYWNLSGDQGQSWIDVTANFTSLSGLGNLFIWLDCGNSYWSDAAVDDVLITGYSTSEELQTTYAALGNHSEGSTYTWVLGGETVGEIYEGFRCYAIDVNGSNSASDWYTQNNTFEVGTEAEPPSNVDINVSFYGGATYEYYRPLGTTDTSCIEPYNFGNPIYQVCNNDTTAINSISVRVNATETGWTIGYDDDLTCEGAVNATTSWQEIWTSAGSGALNQGDCLNISGFMSLNNPTVPYYFYTEFNGTA